MRRNGSAEILYIQENVTLFGGAVLVRGNSVYYPSETPDRGTFIFQDSKGVEHSEAVACEDPGSNGGASAHN